MPTDKIAVAEHKWARKMYEQLSWEFIDHPDDPNQDAFAQHYQEKAEQLHRELKNLYAQKRVFINMDELRTFENLHDQAIINVKKINDFIKNNEIQKAENLIDDIQVMLNGLNVIIDQGQETSNETYAQRAQVLETRNKISKLSKAQTDITDKKVLDEFLSLHAVAQECTRQAEFYTRAGKVQNAHSAIENQLAALSNLESFVTSIPQLQTQVQPQITDPHPQQTNPVYENVELQSKPQTEQKRFTKSDLLRNELKDVRIRIAQNLNKSADVHEQHLQEEIATYKMLAIEYSKEIETSLTAHKTTIAERNLIELKGIEQSLESCLRHAAYNNQQREAAARHVEEQHKLERLAEEQKIAKQRAAEEHQQAEQREAQRRAKEERYLAAQKAEEERLRAEQQATLQKAAQTREQIITYQKTLSEAQIWLASMETSASSIKNPAKLDEFTTYQILAKDFMLQVQSALSSNQPQTAEQALIELGRLLTSAQEIINGPQQQTQQTQHETPNPTQPTPKQHQETKKEQIAYQKKAKGIRNNVDAREKPRGRNPEFYCEVQDGMFCLKHSMNACLGFGAISEKDMEEGLIQTCVEGFKAQDETQLFSEVKNYIPNLTLQAMRSQLAKDPDAFYRRAAKYQQDMLYGGMAPTDFIRYNGSEPLMGIAIMKHKQKELGLPDLKDEWLRKPKTEADLQANTDKIKDIADTGADRLILGAGAHFIALRKNAEGDWFEVDSQEPTAKRINLEEYIRAKSLENKKEALAVLHFGEEISFNKENEKR